LEDIARFVGLLEDVLPSDRIIKFSGTHSVSRQLEQMAKSELLVKISNCYRITEKGMRLADEAELSIENDEELGKIWQIVRTALSSLPSSKLLWDSHLYSALKQLDL
jgi:predicted transcriptional regulator